MIWVGYEAGIENESGEETNVWIGMGLRLRLRFEFMFRSRTEARIETRTVSLFQP